MAERSGPSGTGNVLILYHCKANTGYAIGTLEKVFWEAATAAAGGMDHVHLSYTSYDSGFPEYLPNKILNFILATKIK